MSSILGKKNPKKENGKKKRVIGHAIHSLGII
jgi:hypothetical protein